MGGCATKPKVSKDSDDVPVPAPELIKDQEAVGVTPSETKALESSAAVSETGEKDATTPEAAVLTERVKEIVMDDDKGDDRRKSLGNLFDKENEEKTPSIGSEDVKPAKPEEPSAVETIGNEPNNKSKLVESEKPPPQTEAEGKPAPVAAEEAPEKAEQERASEEEANKANFADGNEIKA